MPSPFRCGALSQVIHDNDDDDDDNSDAVSVVRTTRDGSGRRIRRPGTTSSLNKRTRKPRTEAAYKIIVSPAAKNRLSLVGGDYPLAILERREQHHQQLQGVSRSPIKRHDNNKQQQQAPRRTTSLDDIVIDTCHTESSSVISGITPTDMVHREQAKIKRRILTSIHGSNKNYPTCPKCRGELTYLYLSRSTARRRKQHATDNNHDSFNNFVSAREIYNGNESIKTKIENLLPPVCTECQMHLLFDTTEMKYLMMENFNIWLDGSSDSKNDDDDEKNTMNNRNNNSRRQQQRRGAYDYNNPQNVKLVIVERFATTTSSCQKQETSGTPRRSNNTNTNNCDEDEDGTTSENAILGEQYDGIGKSSSNLSVLSATKPYRRKGQIDYEEPEVVVVKTDDCEMSSIRHCEIQQQHDAINDMNRGYQFSFMEDKREDDEDDDPFFNLDTTTLQRQNCDSTSDVNEILVSQASTISDKDDGHTLVNNLGTSHADGYGSSNSSSTISCHGSEVNKDDGHTPVNNLNTRHGDGGSSYSSDYIKLVNTASEERLILQCYSLKKEIASKQIAKDLLRGNEMTTSKCDKCKMPMTQNIATNGEIVAVDCVTCEGVKRKAKRIAKQKRNEREMAKVIKGILSTSEDQNTMPSVKSGETQTNSLVPVTYVERFELSPLRTYDTPLFSPVKCEQSSRTQPVSCTTIDNESRYMSALEEGIMGQYYNIPENLSSSSSIGLNALHVESMPTTVSTLAEQSEDYWVRHSSSQHHQPSSIMPASGTSTPSAQSNSSSNHPAVEYSLSTFYNERVWQEHVPHGFSNLNTGYSVALHDALTPSSSNVSSEVSSTRCPRDLASTSEQIYHAYAERIYELQARSNVLGAADIRESKSEVTMSNRSASDKSLLQRSFDDNTAAAASHRIVNSIGCSQLAKCIRSIQKRRSFDETTFQLARELTAALDLVKRANQIDVNKHQPYPSKPVVNKRRYDHDVADLISPTDGLTAGMTTVSHVSSEVSPTRCPRNLSPSEQLFPIHAAMSLSPGQRIPNLQQPSTSTISDSLNPTDLSCQMRSPSKLRVTVGESYSVNKPDEKRKSLRKLHDCNVKMQNQASSSSEVSDCNGYFVATKFEDPSHNRQSHSKASSDESLTLCPRNLPRHDMIWRYETRHNNKSHPACGSERNNISERITRLKESLNEVAEYLPNKYDNPELENIHPLNSTFIHPSSHRESFFSFERASSNQAITNVVQARKDDVETKTVLSDQYSHGNSIYRGNLRPLQYQNLPVQSRNLPHVVGNNYKTSMHTLISSTTPVNRANTIHSIRSTEDDSKSIQKQIWHPPSQSFIGSNQNQQQQWSTSVSADPPELNQQQKWSTSISTDPPGHSISTPSWDSNEIDDVLKRDPSVEPLRDPPVDELITDYSIRNSITPKSRGTFTTYASNPISTITPTLLPTSDAFVKVKPEANTSYLTSDYTHVQTTPSWKSYEVDHTNLQNAKSWGDSSMDLLFKEIDDIENEFCSIVASLPGSGGSDGQSLLSGLKTSSINSYLKERMKNNDEQHSLVEITLNKCTSFGSNSSTGSTIVTDVVERMRRIEDCIKQIDSVDDESNTNDNEYYNSREGEMSELIDRLANAAESLRELNEWDD